VEELELSNNYKGADFMSHQESQFDTYADRAVEVFMKDIGIEWAEKVVSVSSVDLEDNSFQTRLNTAHCSTVAREYAEKIRAGDPFPMTVLQPKGNGKFRVVCGRHRATAYSMAQNGKASYQAYIVGEDTPVDLLTALSARDNNSNGVRQGTAETARVAADFLAKLPVLAGSRCHKKKTIQEVSARFGANDSTVSDHYHAKLVAAKMISVGCRAEGVPVNALRSLWKWTENAAWPDIARAVSENATTGNLSKIISSANADKVDAPTLISRIKDAAGVFYGGSEMVRQRKDPAYVTLEHLSLALQDFRQLSSPRNLPNELAEDIASTVEAIRIECKEWKKR